MVQFIWFFFLLSVSGQDSGAVSLRCRECITKVEMTKDSTSSKQQLSVVMTCDFILHWSKPKTIGSFQENN